MRIHLKAAYRHLKGWWARDDLCRQIQCFGWPKKQVSATFNL
ncbi:hypothetical protein I552_5862 [Mycobacterium xenopi 3993]|nr:hypothetical protein I552_5862 [Mycobacterium xenopi 3993]